jgi:hypothetical protein
MILIASRNQTILDASEERVWLNNAEGPVSRTG